MGTPSSALSQAGSAEVQYLYQSPVLDAVVGGGYFDLDIAVDGSDDIIGRRHGNAYAYSYLRYPRNVTSIVGASYDVLEDEQLGIVNSVNPKVGILWNPSASTTVRLGAFKAVSRTLFAPQTIEPTNVAGFNQFFDDPNGTESVRYAAGIDHHFNADLSAGFEFSERDIEIPVAMQSTIVDREETTYRSYVHWTPLSHWAIALEYLRDDFENEEAVIGGPLDTTTYIAPFRISYFHPSGLFARFRMSYFAQDIGDEQRSSTIDDDSEKAVIVDAGIGYRLPNRWGLFEIQVQNLTDKNFRYEGSQDRVIDPITRVPSFSPFPPELTLFARFTLALGR